MTEPNNQELGLHWMEVGRPEKAAEEFRKALSREPEDPWLHSMLAAAYLLMKRYDDAIKEADVAISLNPEFDYALRVKSRAFHAKGDIYWARNVLREAIRLDPTNPDYPGLMSLYLTDENRIAWAKRYAYKGLRIDPKNVLCRRALAIQNINTGRNEEALKIVIELLEEDPESPFEQELLATIKLNQNQLKEASQIYRSSLSLNPLSESAKQGLERAERVDNRSILTKFLDDLSEIFWVY